MGSFWLCRFSTLQSKYFIKIRSSFSCPYTGTKSVTSHVPLRESVVTVFLSAQLPVLSMDISHDSKLIVTCSADKNVKIWGLDFGDCHKSIFAHDESVMQVAFEKDSHYFWTVGKDKMVKYWDGDKV